MSSHSTLYKNQLVSVIEGYTRNQLFIVRNAEYMRDLRLPLRCK
jgi:hypothetical protein